MPQARSKGSFTLETAQSGTLRASVADAVEHLGGDRDSGGLGRETRRRRILASDVERAFAGVGIRAIPHPTVLFAFVDRARFMLSVFGCED